MKNIFSVIPGALELAQTQTNFLLNITGGSEDTQEIILALNNVKHSFLLPINLGSMLNEESFCFSGVILSFATKKIQEEQKIEAVFLANMPGKESVYMLLSLVLPKSLDTLYNEKDKERPEPGAAFYFQYNGKKASTENKGKTYNDCFLLHS